MEKKIYHIRERTYQYALKVIGFLKDLPVNYISQTMGRQLLRSATSIGANIIEAQAAGSKRDFVNFYNHSLKSANESKFWIRLMKDSGHAKDGVAFCLLEEAKEPANILASSLLTMRGKRKF